MRETDGSDDDEFGRLVVARSHALRRTAYLMCGDWHEAEDLVQQAFIKLHAAWGRVQRRDDIDAYLRKTLLRTCIDEKRRARWRRERPASDDLPDTVQAPGEPDPETLSDRDALVAALRGLPPGQRAVLVLRFWEDLGVEETAQALGCSTGTVKSQTSRGLGTLRARLGAGAAGGLLTRAEGKARP
ncbi:RNA polymerase sigma-70 factor (sigma-E family) [Catenulispora sp. GP43]|uniref:SigE family RNA polymerase sigma factor n=1 Tax=Catenulispora sp. GP43 TaxID=3156263 RepID=UPI0035152062